MLVAITGAKAIEELQNPLVLFGLLGQLVFMGRFVVQWYVSERRGQSHIPIAFWYLSIAGALMLLVYSWLREDLVFILAQTLGLFIYVRNLMLIHRHAKRVREASATGLS
ncbi:MAG: lipid-A-disaccharide synthase N-terminal domain-containing protein [Planctomycetia bacterium]|nr:MAG: lipid-A-disaccharide synthase N-terminal domain-containing protein [Planctomycetia bacterium]